MDVVAVQVEVPTTLTSVRDVFLVFSRIDNNFQLSKIQS